MEIKFDHYDLTSDQIFMAIAILPKITGISRVWLPHTHTPSLPRIMKCSLVYFLKLTIVRRTRLLRSRFLKGRRIINVPMNILFIWPFNLTKNRCRKIRLFYFLLLFLFIVAVDCAILLCILFLRFFLNESIWNIHLISNQTNKIIGHIHSIWKI